MNWNSLVAAIPLAPLNITLPIPQGGIAASGTVNSRHSYGIATDRTCYGSGGSGGAGSTTIPKNQGFAASMLRSDREDREWEQLLNRLTTIRRLHSIWPSRWHVICPHQRYMDRMLCEAQLSPMEGVFVSEEHHLLGLSPDTPIVLAGNFRQSPFFHLNPLRELRFLLARFTPQNICVGPNL